MPKPQPLPTELVGRTFDIGSAHRLGVANQRLRASDLVVLSRGIRGPAGGVPELREHAAAALARTPDGWISHITAALIHGLWVPARLARDSRVHLSRYEECTSPRRREVVGHCVRANPGEVTVVDGLRISTPARAWFELLTQLNRVEAVIIGDQLVRRPRPGIDTRPQPWYSLTELAVLISDNGRRQGVRRARAALPLIRVGSDSPSESRLRLAILDAGFPEPELQLRLDPTDPYSPTADLGYWQPRIALQHEGGHHLSPAQQSRDIRRDERWLAEGFRVIRSDVSDTRAGFRRVLELLHHLTSPAT